MSGEEPVAVRRESLPWGGWINVAEVQERLRLDVRRADASFGPARRLPLVLVDSSIDEPLDRLEVQLVSDLDRVGVIKDS